MKSILLDAWTLYRQNFLRIAIITLIVWIPLELFIAWMEHNVFGEDDFRKSYQLQRLCDNLIGIIGNSAIYYHLRERSAQRPSSLGAELGAGFSFWGSMFAARFIAGVGIVVGLILLVVPGIFLAFRLAICEPLVIAEEASGMDAIRRSYELTKGKFWSLVAWFLAGGIPPIIVAMLIYVPFTLIPALDNTLGDAVGSSIVDVAITFFLPLTWAICTHLLQEEGHATPPTASIV